MEMAVYPFRMARTADHEARRAQLRAGARQVALDRGLPAVTVARVAEAAGISVGLVQHYFPSKESLLADVFIDLRTTLEHRVDAATARAERRHERIEQILTAALEQCLPLDARRRGEVYLALAYAGMALEHPDLRHAQTASDDHLRRRIADAVTNGKACGEVGQDSDPEQVAWDLFALVTGLAAQAHHVDSPAARRRARAALAAAVGRTFDGPCSRSTGVTYMR